jgi:Na+/H+-dicarboxylate symporter
VNRVDVEFALDLSRATTTADSGDIGMMALIPTNIFASLAGNDSMKVLVFAVIFGIGMVATERRSGNSVFSALRHIQDVCIQIFDWFNLLVPIGIVALIAPQVARIGPDVYAVLAAFAYAFFATNLLILLAAITLMAFALRTKPTAIFSGMLAPMMLGAATRNTLVCIPLAIETMTEKFKVARQPCDLYIPVGFATLRFGTIVYFSIATLFMGMLLGRSFGIVDMALIAALSVVASFATLGVTGLAALAPLASVLRPFGLSYELAVPLMIIIDPIANMLRVMINVVVNCLIPALATGRVSSATETLAAPAK